jgi:ribosomal protein L40E
MPTARKKTPQAAPKKRIHRARICDSCGAENTPRAKTCSQCGKSRFSPVWIRQLRRINRSFAVQVTDPHPLSDSESVHLTLYKWWPGGNRSFNINSSAQWEAVQRAVDELAPYLKWSTRADLARTLKTRKREAASFEAELKRISAEDPKILEKLVEGIDFTNIKPEDLPEVAEQVSSIAQVLVGADRGMRRAIEEIVKKLPAQGRKATESLTELMEQLTLRQITAVSTEVQRRIELLALFKKRMLDERTYEIRGENSIHRLLESAMWLVDDRWWLMHSNESLRTIVGEAIAAEDKRYEKKRPDFVCGTLDRRLIIVELKRPSHTLSVKDLNQLEHYVTLCEKYSSEFSKLEAAILVGRKKADDLERTIRHRSQAFKVRTYSDLVHDTERRYKAYLDALKAS